MKAVEVQLLKDYDKSFLLYHEKNPFSRWHHHPEYELVMIVKGCGKRMIGDNIDRFEDGDLVFLGSHLPHEWLCDDEYFSKDDGFKGEGIVIQFQEDFLGKTFFEIPENRRLKKVLMESNRGFKLEGYSKAVISDIMKKMLNQDPSDNFYSLINIFKILSNSDDHIMLSSPNFLKTFQSEGTDAMKKVIQYILQNFHQQIHIEDLLEIANMSSTAFSVLFKKSHNMTFKEYLVKVRVGYACKLLCDEDKSISQISFEAGFENLSNFNRLFKKVKNQTPSEFIAMARKSEKYAEFY